MNHPYASPFLVSTLLGLLAPVTLRAQTTPVDTTTLRNRTQRLSGVEVIGGATPTRKTELSAEATASPASVTLVGRDYVAKQAVNSYGDLLRPLAGVNVSNYQLGGVAYGIQMRGYTVVEHARDVAFSIDGALQNQGSSLSANGYADLNPLIPETVRRIEVVRGPFSPFYGDHALGGVIRFDTEDRLNSSMTLSGGTFGQARGLGILGFGKPESPVGGYVAVAATRTDGFRDNSKDKSLNGLAKLSFKMPGGTASLRVQAYADNHNSASYLKRADIDADRVDRRDAVNGTDGGSTRQQNAVFNYQGSDPARYFSATLYAQHHDFIRFRDGGTGQRQTRDNRVWGGGDVRYTRLTKLGSLPAQVAAGLSFRTDDIEGTRFSTVARQQVKQDRERDITTSTPSAYAQLQVRPIEQLKLTASARYDRLYYHVRVGANDVAALANTRVKSHPDIFSPKVGAAFSFTPTLSVFANAARGFKSPDGFAELPVNPDLGVSKLASYEVGLSADDASGRLHGVLAAYQSNQTNEVQIDPLGQLKNFGRTRRQGVEAEARVRLVENVDGPTVFGNYTYLKARLRNGADATEYVTDTPQYLGTLGLDWTFGSSSSLPHRLTLSVYDQLIGPKYLNSDGSLESKAFTRVAGKLIYTRTSWAGFRVYVESSFYPGSGALDEVSFLSGPDILTSAQARATVTGGIKVPF
ncbi:TonB-dependent receptor [Hymenobacter elongatus]|uniref:TonB-dependent receptor n=1 Tax=Hymenobacter elongatus TaxID=877208 RepID=A0A4Z0PR46_9BACT|nr:TonB-dependent receptor [Hymenobacter elongatus]TGE20197.1 TonB-dependent receptor [Hymenobacter elongatus]